MHQFLSEGKIIEVCGNVVLTDESCKHRVLYLHIVLILLK